MTVFAIWPVVLVAIGTPQFIRGERPPEPEAKMLASFDMDMIKALDQDGDGVDERVRLRHVECAGASRQGDRALREAVQLVRCRWEGRLTEADLDASTGRRETGG